MTLHHIGAVTSCAIIFFTGANGVEFLGKLSILNITNKK